MSELKPCPFCGSEMEYPELDHNMALCSNIECWLYSTYTPVVVLNTRPIEDALCTEIDRLQAENERYKNDLAETQACLLERNIELDSERKRLKQHIEMIVEHKEPDVIAQENFKKLQDEVADLREKNIKLRLELQTLRFKESQENRFVWWVYQVYARNVSDLLTELERTTFPVTPFGMSNTIKRLKEYTEHIYDGAYLDVEISADVKSDDEVEKGVKNDK